MLDFSGIVLNVSYSKQIGFLHLSGDLIQHLKNLLVPFLPKLTSLILLLLENASAQVAIDRY